MRKGNEYIFTAKQLEGHKDNILKAAVVRLLIDHGITYDIFSERHRKFMIDSGRSTTEIATHRNNLLKALLNKDDITYSMFKTITKDILKLNLTNLSMTFRNERNEVIHLSMDRTTY